MRYYSVPNAHSHGILFIDVASTSSEVEQVRLGLHKLGPQVRPHEFKYFKGWYSTLTFSHWGLTSQHFAYRDMAHQQRGPQEYACVV
jgi:hypothetical protein